MVMAGYLKAVPDGEHTYAVSVPNRELSMAFLDMVMLRSGAGNCGIRMHELRKALEEDDAEGVGTAISSIFMEFESVRILRGESDHQNFLYGIMLGTLRTYRVSVEGEAGEGYYDIRLESLRRDRPNIIMEIKRLGKDEPDSAAEQKALEALEQVRSRGYASGMEGDTTAYGVAFRSKTPTVRMARL